MAAVNKNSGTYTRGKSYSDEVRSRIVLHVLQRASEHYSNPLVIINAAPVNTQYYDAPLFEFSRVMRSQIAARFCVSDRFVGKLWQQCGGAAGVRDLIASARGDALRAFDLCCNQQGLHRTKPRGGAEPMRKSGRMIRSAATDAKLQQMVAAQPELYLDEIVKEFRSCAAQLAIQHAPALSTVCSWLAALKLKRRVIAPVALERQSARVLQLRDDHAKLQRQEYWLSAAAAAAAQPRRRRAGIAAAAGQVDDMLPPGGRASAGLPPVINGLLCVDESHCDERNACRKRGRAKPGKPLIVHQHHRNGAACRKSTSILCAVGILCRSGAESRVVVPGRKERRMHRYAFILIWMLTFLLIK